MAYMIRQSDRKCLVDSNDASELHQLMIIAKIAKELLQLRKDECVARKLGKRNANAHCKRNAELAELARIALQQHIDELNGGMML
jgi:hypothetical protein